MHSRRAFVLAGEVRTSEVRYPMIDSASSHTTPYSLKRCFDAMHSGPWRFIQLRGEGGFESWRNEEDVDLLGSRHSVDLLIAEAKTWVLKGWCHFRIVCRRARKVELCLYSIDGRENLLLDLWIHMPQLDRGRQWISFETANGGTKDSDSSILRWSMAIELAVYIHHLICKKKRLGSSRVQQRLGQYQRLCEDECKTELASELLRIRNQQSISKAFELQMLRVLQEELSPQNSQSYRYVDTLWKKIFLNSPRRKHLISVMGCDGVGKSSLIECLERMSPESVRALTGKHLYRKSIFYKLMVIFVRPLMFQDREKFDETWAPFVYLRACLKLYFFELRVRSGLMLIDRNILDFLYLDRKTDQPGFSRFLGLSRVFGSRIPTIHCVIEHAALMTRKQEMSEQGHLAYDRDMMEQFSSRQPTDYTLFYNGGTLDESLNGMKCIVNDILEKPDFSLK